MPSEVHFLPWKERVEFPSWIEKTEAFKIIKEHMYTAVKIHFGEEGNIGDIRPEFVKPVAEGVKINPKAGDVLPGGFEHRVRWRIVLRWRSGRRQGRQWWIVIVLPRAAGIGGDVFGLPDGRRIRVGETAAGYEQQT